MTTSDAVTIQLPPSVTVVEGEGGLPLLRVLTPLCTGYVYLLGAHLSAWTPTGHDPVLWMSRESDFEPGKPIRGGVPLCFPWFGGGPEGDKVPGHGVVRVVPWTLTEATDDDGTVTLVLKVTSDDVAGVLGAEHVPGAFEAIYTVRMGADLRLELAVTNTGEQTLEIEEALHTYFAVHDVTGVVVQGLDGASYLDKVAGETRTQDGPVVVSAETDRVYESTGTAEIVDPGRHRTITITKENSANTVVWNPWVAKAAAMPDFGDDEWPGMICVETANALSDGPSIEPGATHTMSANIAVAIA